MFSFYDIYENDVYPKKAKEENRIGEKPIGRTSMLLNEVPSRTAQTKA
jgi:hypothetical protein